MAKPLATYNERNWEGNMQLFKHARWFHAAIGGGLAVMTLALASAPRAWSADTKPIVIRMSTGGPPDNFRGEAMKYFEGRQGLRGTGSLLTRCWRKADSNRWSHYRRSRLSKYFAPPRAAPSEGRSV